MNLVLPRLEIFHLRMSHSHWFQCQNTSHTRHHKLQMRQLSIDLSKSALTIIWSMTSHYSQGLACNVQCTYDLCSYWQFSWNLFKKIKCHPLHLHISSLFALINFQLISILANVLLLLFILLLFSFILFYCVWYLFISTSSYAGISTLCWSFSIVFVRTLIQYISITISNNLLFSWYFS